MNRIHISDLQGQQVNYDPQEAQRLWEAGSIPRDALYWCEGMPDWRPAAEFFNTAPPVLATAPADFTSRARGFVKDPTGLTRFLIILLWVYLGFGVLSGLLSIISLATGNVTNSDPERLTALDIINLLVSLPQLAVIITTAVVFLMWTHRANRNARGLGADGMRFTPGWTVGWYFVPIANLWKPYQAMKEIWQASADPGAWRAQKPPALLAGWWALWIVSNFASNASIRLTFQANTSGALLVSEIISLVSELVDIPLCLVAIQLVRRIIAMQRKWAEEPLQSVCSICRQPKAPAEMVFLNQGWVCAHCKPVALQQMQEGVSGS